MNTTIFDRSLWLRVLGLAIATLFTVHLAVGSSAAQAETARGGCFHYVCDQGGTCTTQAVNHTCCFVEGEGGEPPECASDSCLLGGGPCGGPE